MRLVVGYLATPSGADGLALGVLLARSLGAEIDICLVLPDEEPVPTRIPVDSAYEELLSDQAVDWLVEARATVPDDITVRTHLRSNESFAQGLLDIADELDAEMIVIGASGDGLLGRHSIGSVTGELLHCAHLPMALAPRGMRHSTAKAIRSVTCAVGTRAGAGLLLREAVGVSRRSMAPLRLVSLVALDMSRRRRSDTPESVRQRAIAHAAEVLESARSGLPEDVTVDSVIADGANVESAVSKLEWSDGDLIMVGSSRLAHPRHLFLGSTVSKMLRVVPVPMIVVPKEEV
ncbi:universal stress protein [Rhodococcus oryzae]|uniref:Universal stress protein n=1 Tax=Rhodococcus oryzae TaxID=2571143 RepID=A0ABY2RJ55_9NOCA|nr:universal stress protein [Rhodococcus oryzae]TJZ77710.1 universal stress protein [Rhodococcus oryzae]